MRTAKKKPVKKPVKTIAVRSKTKASPKPKPKAAARKKPATKSRKRRLFKNGFIRAGFNIKIVLAFMAIFVAIGTATLLLTRAAETTITINDNTVGTGINQFQYSGTWCSATTTGAYNNDEHCSNQAGAYYTVKFSGTQIKAFSMKHPNYGIAGYSVDGGTETMVNHYAPSRQFNFLAYASPTLPNGIHTLKVRVTGTKPPEAANTYIAADRVDITTEVAQPTTASLVTVNDNTIGTGNNQYQYSGTWCYTTTAGAYKDDEHCSNQVGAYYTVKFSGTQIKAYSMKHPNYGIAGYSIDGGAETLVDHYAAAREFNFLAYASPVLSSGVHTLKVRVTGSKQAAAAFTYIAADKVEIVTTVTATPPPAPAPTPSPTPVPAPAPAPPPASSSKRFILHQQWPAPVDYVANNVAAYDALPFDGTTFTITESDKIQRPTPVDATSVRNQIMLMQGKPFKRASHNMVLVYATPGAAFNNFTVAAQNFGKLAAAVRDSGNIEAIKFDVEEYYGFDTWRDGACAGLGEAQCRTAAHAAGKQTMQEIIRNWPTAKIMTSFGAWVSSTEALSYFNTMFPTNDVAWANIYQGHFFAGMMEATYGTQAQYIDGGELYYIPKNENYTSVKNYMKNTFPTAAGYIVPQAMRAQWPAYYHMSFGTYDWPGDTNTWISREPQNAGHVREDNKRALAGTDQYVWYYSERHNFANNPSSRSRPEPPSDWWQALWDAYNTISHP